MKKILFQEKQKFTQWWLWLILLVPTIYVGYHILSPFFKKNAIDDLFHSSTSSDSIVFPPESLVAILILLAVLLFMFFMTMTTKVDEEKIAVKHLFFVKKQWLWQDIASAEIITYGFVGYGIRISLNYGTVYNVKGNQGLLLQLKNGKKRLIGTQKPEELQKVIANLHRL